MGTQKWNQTAWNISIYKYYNDSAIFPDKYINMTFWDWWRVFPTVFRSTVFNLSLCCSFTGKAFSWWHTTLRSIKKSSQEMFYSSETHRLWKQHQDDLCSVRIQTFSGTWPRVGSRCGKVLRGSSRCALCLEAWWRTADQRWGWWWRCRSEAGPPRGPSHCSAASGSYPGLSGSEPQTDTEIQFIYCTRQRQEIRQWV